MLDFVGQGSSFFCPSQSVYLGCGQTNIVDLLFLPFKRGLHSCSVLLHSDEVGEFVYKVEAVGTLPLPTGLPFTGGWSSRITSAAAAGM